MLLITRSRTSSITAETWEGSAYVYVYAWWWPDGVRIAFHEYTVRLQDGRQDGKYGVWNAAYWCSASPSLSRHRINLHGYRLVRFWRSKRHFGGKSLIKRLFSEPPHLTKRLLTLFSCTCFQTFHHLDIFVADFRVQDFFTAQIIGYFLGNTFIDAHKWLDNFTVLINENKCIQNELKYHKFIIMSFSINRIKLCSNESCVYMSMSHNLWSSYLSVNLFTLNIVL